MINGYTPVNKRRPPCYGCRHLKHTSDSRRVSAWICTATSKRGRTLCDYSYYVPPERRPMYEQNMERQLKNRMRPSWCPEEKKGE